MKQTLLITGVSKGIGRALAQHYLNSGAKVLGTNRSGILPEFHHPNLKVFPLDLSRPESRETLVKTLESAQLKIDVLINNAGIGPDLNFTLPEAESFQQTFEVNTTGTVFLTERCLPLLNKSGKIINISSKMGAINPCIKSNATAYRMSKAALNMYTKTLANRLAEQIKVASVHPGWVQTTISNTNHNAPYTPQEAAAEVITFIRSDFKSGTFWNIETQSEMEW